MLTEAVKNNKFAKSGNNTKIKVLEVAIREHYERCHKDHPFSAF